MQAKKSLGQNFLRNPNVTMRIASLLDAESRSCILEIGPGRGALTEKLERLPHARLLMLEKDNELALERQRHASLSSQCLLMDARTFAWERLGREWIVCGNLPYNIASPLIWDLAEKGRNIRKACFMVQKEVAERICASPQSKAYGALSVWVQSFWEPDLSFLVGPKNFWPVPKVESAVFVASPLPNPLPASLTLSLKSLLDLCFQNRRKQLGGILRRAGFGRYEEFFEKYGIAQEARPESLRVSDFHAMSAFFDDELKKAKRI